MIKTFYFSDKTGDLYPSVEEAVIAEMARLDQSSKQKDISDLLDKFEKVRKEYIKQLKLLQSEFEPEFLNIISSIENLGTKDSK